MRILGIDPGLANTGWGVVDFDGQKFRPVSFGVINTTPDETLEKRISFIGRDVGKIAMNYGADHVSIEDIFFARNEKSAIGVAKVIGAVCYSMFLLNIDVTIFTPLQIKKAVTGTGTADKHQVQELTRILLGLDKIPRPDHAADALGAALCYGNTSATLNKLGVFK
ncbi:MAG: crossover junction endodeoxyribonuclease RuvC [Sphaerochaetaceae bacterium]|nr:crossover junction endodeoxyribonuclease RuvC [Sphaerochaetaceae bacterium]